MNFNDVIKKFRSSEKAGDNNSFIKSEEKSEENEKRLWFWVYETSRIHSGH